jgi:hypothetical protein
MLGVIAIPNVQIVHREFLLNLGKMTCHSAYRYEWRLCSPWLQWFSDVLVVGAPVSVSPGSTEFIMGKETGGDREERSKLTGLIHSGAGQFAERDSIIVVIGYTRKP